MGDVKVKKLSGVDLLRITIISIFIVALVAFSVDSAWYFIQHPSVERTSQVGTVISKSQDEVTIKNGTQTELYLNIEFDRVGFKSIEVEPTTYFGSEVGERVSFGLVNDRDAIDILKFMWGFVVVAIAIIGIIVIFIRWLFDFKE